MIDSDLQYRRTNHINVSEWTGATFLDDGNLLTGWNAGYPSGNLFFVVDREGTIRHSFGQPTHGNDFRHVAYAGGSTFWAMSPLRYELELWSTDGERLASIQRDATWFPPAPSGYSWTPEDPKPYALGLMLDSADRLWVTTVVDVDFAATEAADRGDWWVEVFDARTGMLLASQLFDSYGDGVPTGVLDGSVMYHIRELEDGTFSADIVQPELVPR